MTVEMKDQLEKCRMIINWYDELVGGYSGQNWGKDKAWNALMDGKINNTDDLDRLVYRRTDAK